MEQLQRILFIDIETVPVVAEYMQLSPLMRELWDRKARSLRSQTGMTDDPSSLFPERAGIFAEFAKTVCIGIGCLTEEPGEQWKLLLKAFSGDDEQQLLEAFTEGMMKFAARSVHFRFCGHNIREFDIPFLCRRLLINGLPLPEPMQLHGKKPWEISHLDTLELWRFGDYKNYTSLALLAEVLGIPSPKEDIDGSMVGAVYWQEKNLNRIVRYCLRDVHTTARVFLTLSGHPAIQPEPVYLQEEFRS